MRTHGLRREELREAPLDVQALIGVGIVRAPELGEVLEHLVVHTRTATRTEHHGQGGILLVYACEHIIYSTHVVDVEVALLLLVVGRIDVGDHAVAVPLEVSHLRILRHDAIYDTIHVILHLGVRYVEHQLVAVVVSLPVGLHDDPVGVLLEEFALGVHHLWLYPYAELHARLLCIPHQSGYSVGQLVLRCLPVTQSSMVILARVLVGKPSVIEQEHIHSQILCILHQFSQTLLVEVESGVLPVVEQGHSVARTHVHLIQSGPVVQVARSLSHSILTHREDELRSGEHLSRLQFVVRSIRVDSRNHTQRSHVIHLEGEAEVACPSYCTQHHTSLILSGRRVESQFEERLLLHGSTCTQFRIHYLLARDQLGCLRLTLLGPVAVVGGHKILRALEVEHCRGVAPQRDGCLLLVRHLAPCLYHALLRVSHIVQFHRHGILLVGQSDDSLSATLHRLLLHRLEIQISSHVSVSMRDSQSRLKEVLGTRSGTHLMPTLAHRPVRSGIHIPLQLVIVSGVLQLLSQIHLIESPLGRHLHHQVRLPCCHTDGLLCQSHHGKQTQSGNRHDSLSHLI